MNFLAHTALAGPSEELRLGGLLGDFVKSTLDGPSIIFSDGIVRGIRLHRAIDSRLDQHPVFQNSRERVSPRHRRVAGILVDMFYDHFLARHWRRFYDIPLEVFAQGIYDMLDAHATILPPALDAIRRPMRAHNWLASYRDIASIHTAVNRMALRLSRPTLLQGAAVELEDNYSGFEEDFFLVYADLQHYATDFMARKNPEADKTPAARPA